MTREIGDYIDDIIENMLEAQKYLKDITYEDFLKDRKTQYATERAIEIIGEAAKNVPQSVRDNYPKIPWQGITGMRNRLAHEYFGVKLGIIWKTIKERIPVELPLFEKLRQAEQEKQVEQAYDIDSHPGRHR